MPDMTITNQKMWDGFFSVNGNSDFSRLIARDAEKWGSAMEEAAKGGVLTADMMYDCFLKSTPDDIDCFSAFAAAQLLRDTWVYGEEIAKLWPDFVTRTNLMF